MINTDLLNVIRTFIKNNPNCRILSIERLAAVDDQEEGFGIIYENSEGSISSTEAENASCLNTDISWIDHYIETLTKDVKS